MVEIEKSQDEYPKEVSPVTVIQNIIIEAFAKWDKSYMASGLENAIKNIPEPRRIKKVVCLGFGLIDAIDYHPPSGRLNQRDQRAGPLAQHTAALAMVRQLQNMTNQRVELYTADPAYGPFHKEALGTLDKVESIGIKFKFCDTSHGKHEQFTKTDENTLLFAERPFCYDRRTVSEYTRPAVMICLALPWDLNPPKDPEPKPACIWYEVNPSKVERMKDARTSVKVPGVPVYATPPFVTKNVLTLQI